MKQFSEDFLLHMNVQKGNVIKQSFCPHVRTITNIEEVFQHKSRHYDICSDCGKTVMQGSFDISVDELVEILEEEPWTGKPLFIDGHIYHTYKN